MQIINAGLRRIADILKQCDPHPQTDICNELVKKAGDIFRLLTNLVEPLQKANGRDNLPQLDSITQDTLLRSLYAKLKIILGLLTSGTPDPAEIAKATIFVARVLHFDLGLAGVWAQDMKDLCSDLAQLLVDLIIVSPSEKRSHWIVTYTIGQIYGSGPTLDTIVFPLLLDTLYYLLDGMLIQMTSQCLLTVSAEIPVDPKATTLDPFHGYPTFPLRGLPTYMPEEYRIRMRNLLPYLDPNVAVSDLVYAPKDQAGSSSEQHLAPVQNRPWEWTEYLGDAVAADLLKSATDGRHTSHHGQSTQPADQGIPNTTSLPLDLFNAKVVGKRLDVSDPKTEGAAKMLQDTTLAESVFRRDWREARVDASVLEANFGQRSLERSSDGTGSGPSSGSERPSNSRMASPAGSVRSRGTPVGGVGSRRTSPATAYASQPSGLSRVSGSLAEPIDVDSLEVSQAKAGGSGGGVKRKASEDDDDIQILEGPVPSSSVARKPKPRPRVKKK